MKDKVVTITMYSEFADATTYYFAFGDAEPISFKTATNAIQYVDRIEIVEKSYVVEADAAAIEYKLLNKDGVELKIAQTPIFTVENLDVAWVEANTKIYFFAAGETVVKATLDIGYDAETFETITKTATATLKGVSASAATKTGKVFSYNGTATDEKHSVRIGAPGTLSVKYSYTSGDPKTITVGTTAGYYLKSTDETIAMINGANIVGVNKGNATIVLYSFGEDNAAGTSDDVVEDAFAITVLEANHGKSATATLSKNTLNLDTTGTLTTPDQITLKVSAVNLDDKDYNANVTVEIKQVDNNKTYVGVGFTNATTTAGDIVIKKDQFTTPGGVGTTWTDSNYATIRFTVKVTDNDNNDAVLCNQTLSFVVASYAADDANSYKLTASETRLDTSLKNYGEKFGELAKASKITVNRVKTTSYGEFYCGTAQFALIEEVGDITTTAASNSSINYVIRKATTSYPSGYDPASVDEAAAHVNKNADDYINILSFYGTDNNTRAKAGTYTFTGYRVAYGADGKMSSKSSLGAASVVIAASDVAPTAEVVAGKANDLEKAITAADLTSVFKVTWDDLNSKDLGTRVQIDAASFVANANVNGT